MAVYAIGDIQGCYEEFSVLLEKLRFDPSRDRLWLTGDLVNRGPNSLAVLRRVRELGDAAITVLGNHDLHLLAQVFMPEALQGRRDTFHDVLDAPDCQALISWLRRRPVLHYSKELNCLMVHAGVPPQWDLELAARCAKELEEVLGGDGLTDFLQTMYGDQPEQWSGDLRRTERLRFTVNCLTRLRFCDAEGRIDLRSKGPPGSQPEGFMPWFQVPGRRTAGVRVVFGHWSTLGLLEADNLLGLDTGCVWGGCLTARRLDRDEPRVSVPCRGIGPPTAGSD